MKFRHIQNKTDTHHRSHLILLKVKDYLSRGVPADVILELIDEMEGHIVYLEEQNLADMNIKYAKQLIKQVEEENLGEQSEK